MANKQISQLTEATSVNVSDLFVLEQSGAAKKLTGQTLLTDLATALDGHGGIVSIAKTGTSGLVDTYTITLADGTTATFSVTNGQDGTDGTNGVSPVITVTAITGGHRLTIVSAGGTDTVDVMDGTNGTNGTNGTDGVTYTPAVSEAGVISWTNDGGRQNPNPVDIHGTNGTDGTDGTDGVTFTPSVSAAGVISWTNDGGRVNPQSVNIKGEPGEQGDNWFVYIKWASEQPTSDADMGDVPDAWMGVYGGAASSAPTHYTDYAWYEVKGATGNDGNNGLSIGSVVWLSNSSGSPQGTAGTTDTYQVKLSDNTVVGTFEVTNGLNGTGLVDSVNGVAPVNGEVTLTASDVGAATTPLHISASISTSPAAISDSRITSTMRIISIQFGTPSVVKKDVAWTTSDGSLVLGDSTTFSSSTTVDIILAETT